MGTPVSQRSVSSLDLRVAGLSPGPSPSALVPPSPPPRFRASCQKIIAHKMFDHVVLVFIFLNCITIALERPDIDPGSTVRPLLLGGGVSWVRPAPLTALFPQERVFLSVSNYIFTAIFVAEMTVKVPAPQRAPGSVLGPHTPSCPAAPTAAPLPSPRLRPHLRPEPSSPAPGQVVALSLVSGEHAYLQSSWNVLDGLLVLVSLVDIIVALASAGGAKILGILRVLRLLRTLRPLRWAGWVGDGAGQVREQDRWGRVGPERGGSLHDLRLLHSGHSLGMPSSSPPLPCAGSSAVPLASSWWWRP